MLYLWVVEQNFDNQGWYPLIDYIRRRREPTRALKKELETKAYHYKLWNPTAREVKYRIRKYINEA